MRAWGHSPAFGRGTPPGRRAGEGRAPGRGPDTGSAAALSEAGGTFEGMRIATWNVNSITARLPRLLAWLEASGTDVLCVQETKCSQEQFPFDELRALGYEAAVNCTGRWNGVALLSRVGLEDVVVGLPGGPLYEEAEEPRAVSATCGPVRLWSVYVPNGREVGHDHYAYKLRWFEALRAAVADDAAGGRPSRSWATTTSRPPTRTCTTRRCSRA